MGQCFCCAPGRWPIPAALSKGRGTEGGQKRPCLAKRRAPGGGSAAFFRSERKRSQTLPGSPAKPLDLTPHRPSPALKAGTFQRFFSVQSGQTLSRNVPHPKIPKLSKPPPHPRHVWNVAEIRELSAEPQVRGEGCRIHFLPGLWDRGDWWPGTRGESEKWGNPLGHTDLETGHISIPDPGAGATCSLCERPSTSHGPVLALARTDPPCTARKLRSRPRTPPQSPGSPGTSVDRNQIT